MSLFGDLDLDGALSNAEDPFRVKPGTWPGVLTSVKYGPTKSGTKSGLTFKFTYTEGEDYNPNSTRDVINWQHVPDAGDDSPEARRSLGYLKRALSNLGVPESRMETVSVDDLVGLWVWVTVKEEVDSDFPRFVRAEVRDEESANTSTDNSWSSF